MTRIRWWLARWIAPDAFVEAPPHYEGEKVFILIRLGEDMHAWWEAKKFRLKLESKVPALNDEWPVSLDDLGPHGKFVGTI